MADPEDQLHTLIRNTLWGLPYADIVALSTAILHDGWTPKEPATVDDDRTLDTYPVGTVILCDDVAYQRITRSFFCWSTHGSPHRISSEDLHSRGTIRLLHTPK